MAGHGTGETRARVRLRANFGQELRHRPCLHQRGPHRLAHEIVNHRLLPETHLGLRRMHIHIDFGGRHLDEKQNHRIDRRRQNAAIRFGDGMLNEAIANQPSIHENKNRIAIELLNFRLGDEAMQAHFAEIVWRGHPRPRSLIRKAGGFTSGVLRGPPPRRRLRQADTLQWLHCRQRNQLVQGLASKNLVHTFAMTGYRRRHQQRIRCRVQLEVFFRMRQRVVGYERSDVGQFGRLRP